MAIQKTGGFDDRFLAKLSKVDQQGIENFLTSLVREKQFLHVLFNAVLDGLVVLRPNLEVLYINNSAVELLGISRRGRIYREQFSTLVDVPAFRELLARFALKRERIVRAEIEIPEPNARWLEVSILPLEAELGKSASGDSVVVIHDNTAGKLAQEEREKAGRSETLARLTASLAHEIKNPLNSLQIHAQLMNRALHDPDRRASDHERILQSSDVILEEISRLNRVVNDFLTAVRPTRPMKNRADINRLIEHVYATLQPELEARGIICSLRLDRDIPPVEIDPAQMTQVVLNLLKNSMEALEEQREALASRPASLAGAAQEWRPTLEIHTRMLLDERYLVKIVDNGPGIPEENLRRVHEPYFTTKFSGTGLGLAIVSRIVEEHGGLMHIASEPGKGTVVSISFLLDGRPVRLLGQDLPVAPALGHDEKYTQPDVPPAGTGAKI